MKMSTAVVVAGADRVPQWKPGHPLSLSYGEGTFSFRPSSRDNRLPLVSPVNVDSSTTTSTTSTSTTTTLLPRAPISGRKKMKEESGGSSSVANPSSSSSSLRGGEERRKRFPILGPTRQETEMYFRNRRSVRRSAKDRLKAEARALVTRSADRAILPESTPPRLLPTPSASTTIINTIATTTNTSTITSVPPATTTTTTTTTTATANKDTSARTHAGSSRDLGDPEKNSVNSFHSPLSNSCEGGVECPVAAAASSSSPCLPGFEAPLKGSQSMPTSSSPALLERLENSPEQLHASLPLPGFHVQHLRHGQQSGASPVAHSAGRKKSETFCEFGQQQQQQSQRAARTLRGEQQQQLKTLQPSKHGFHLRSKSPTFKRLVAAAEKLQKVAVVVVDPNTYRPLYADTRKTSRNNAGRASPAAGGIVLPAVAGVWDGGETAAGEEGGEGESDEEVAYLYPHPFLSSLPHSTYRTKHISAVSFDKHKLTRSISTTMCSNPKHPEGFSHRSPAAADVLRGRTHCDSLHGLSAWEVDSLSAAESAAIDHARMTVPLGGTFTGETHTELHLFLPRLADTVSEDGSIKATAPGDQRHCCSRPMAPETQTPKRVSQREKGMPHIVPSQRGPQRSHSFHQQPQSSCPAGGERNGRQQERRFFVSPNGRVVKGDRTPSNKKRVTAASPSPPQVEIYESYVYEPYLKGEHLKEKLDDLPTLISLDQD